MGLRCENGIVDFTSRKYMESLKWMQGLRRCLECGGMK